VQMRGKSVVEGAVLSIVVVVIVFFTGCVFTSEPPSRKYIEYPVRKDDTLFIIAERFQVHPQDIVSCNNIQLHKPLWAGLVLKIPYNGQALQKRRDDIMTGGHVSASKSTSGRSDEVKAAPDEGSKKLVALSGAKKYVGQLLWPVSNAPMVSPFGKRWLSFHEGLDFSIKSIFHARRHFLSCFSRRMAVDGSSYCSK